MTEATAIGILKEAFSTMFWVALPLLAVSMLVGIVVSFLQAITQIHDQTLSFVPKILVVGFVLVTLMAGIFNRLTDFTTRLWEAIPQLIH